MTNTLARINPGQRQYHETIDDARTRAERRVDQEVNRLRLLVNDALDPEESERFVDELSGADRYEQLATVRNWAHRVGIAEKPESPESPEVSRVLCEIEKCERAISAHESNASGYLTWWLGLDYWTGKKTELELQLEMLSVRVVATDTAHDCPVCHSENSTQDAFQRGGRVGFVYCTDCDYESGLQEFEAIHNMPRREEKNES